jgi:hypothetical protein
MVTAGGGEGKARAPRMLGGRGAGRCGGGGTLAV